MTAEVTIIRYETWGFPYVAYAVVENGTTPPMMRYALAHSPLAAFFAALDTP